MHTPFTAPTYSSELIHEAASLPCVLGHDLAPIVDDTGDITIFLANKQLSIEVPASPYVFFGTLIATTYGEKMPGSTTALFTQARKIMGHLATRTETPVSYVFSTKNEEMIKWAHSHGERIFDWVVDTDRPAQYRATTIIDAE